MRVVGGTGAGCTGPVGDKEDLGFYPEGGRSQGRVSSIGDT